MRFSKLIVALLITSTPPAVNAADLGGIRPAYSIEEKNTLDMIMKKLHEREYNGEPKRSQEEAVRRSMGNIKNMKPVDGITTVHARMQRFIDSTVTYTRPVTTDDGRIMVPTGTEINPLDMTSLTKTLVLFDDHDPEQCETAGRLVAEGGQLKVKPVLIIGPQLDLAKVWKAQVFYGQESALSRRFGITTMPATIRQQGKVLVLDEIPVRELQ